MSLISVYFKEKNGNLNYTKCIIPEEKLGFFKKFGAFKTQAEAESENQNVELTGNASVSSSDKPKIKNSATLKK